MTAPDAIPFPVAATLLQEAAAWRLVSLLFERPGPEWLEQVLKLADEVSDPVLKAAAEAARQYLAAAAEALRVRVGPAPAEAA